MCPACGSRRVTVVFEPPTGRSTEVRKGAGAGLTSSVSTRVPSAPPGRSAALIVPQPIAALRLQSVAKLRGTPDRPPHPYLRRRPCDG